MAATDVTPLSAASAPDVQATFCSTLVDQWLRLGVRHAVVAPGSRSTPMALALTERDDIAVHVVHDERVAAFTALGLAVTEPGGPRAAPALLLCTSGTAAANFLPAIAEAGLSEIPMIVLTADRPEELRGVGAPQTIDQIELYGSHVRWFHDPGVPDAAGAGEWRTLAATAFSRSGRGPVHVNLPFREPLVGAPLALPASIDAGGPDEEDGRVDRDASLLDRVDAGTWKSAVSTAERGLILVGGMHGIDLADVSELEAATGWPVVADPQSGRRRHTGVASIDALLRVDGASEEFLPDVIVRIGRPSASKLLAQWTARPEPLLIQVGGPGRIDPSGSVAATSSMRELIDAAAGRLVSGEWRSALEAAGRRADAVIEAELAKQEALTEPSTARTLVDHLPIGAQLTVSSSMPVRDVEWFGGRTGFVHANRGANGIDGVVSTALGRALARPVGSPPSFVLIGDLAFVHDSNALVALNRRGVDLRIVVIDNDGGGIFSFLPQSTLLAHERFEELFGTPLGTDVLALAAGHGIDTSTAGTVAELTAQIVRPGPWVCRVPSDRERNVEVHDAIHEAVRRAFRDAGR